MFKESEQKICSDKRYIHLLCQQLQKIIRRKDITIKERIQKKLSKLTPEDLKGFIDLRKDICFNDKKQVLSLEKKITHAPDSEKLSANSFEKVTGRSVFDIEGRL